MGVAVCKPFIYFYDTGPSVFHALVNRTAIRGPPHRKKDKDLHKNYTTKRVLKCPFVPQDAAFQKN